MIMMLFYCRPDLERIDGCDPNHVAVLNPYLSVSVRFNLQKHEEYTPAPVIFIA
jgi:hypothetical protein